MLGLFRVGRLGASAVQADDSAIPVGGSGMSEKAEVGDRSSRVAPQEVGGKRRACPANHASCRLLAATRSPHYVLPFDTCENTCL